jgi:toxin ParE1/3/4
VKARFTRRALRDAERIFAYLDEHSPAGAISVKRALKRTIETIETFPMGGRGSGWKDLRERPVSPYPYIVYWSVDREQIWIIHIRHAARRPPAA